MQEILRGLVYQKPWLKTQPFSPQAELIICLKNLKRYPLIVTENFVAATERESVDWILLSPSPCIPMGLYLEKSNALVVLPCSLYM